MQNPYQQPTHPGGLYPPPLQAPREPDTVAGGGRTGRRRRVVGICALTALAVVAAGTGVALGVRENRARASAVAAASAADPTRPLVAGWKTVINPTHGTAFDVPPGWEVLEPQVFSGYEDSKDREKVLIGHTAPAFYKSRWCTVDGDGDGSVSDVRLANTGTKGAGGAKDPADIAVKEAPTWVYAAYTQPDKSVVTSDKPVAFTTKSGVKGSYVRARSSGAARTDPCAGDGQAIVFGFRNSRGDLVSWDFYGRTGVPGAVDDALIMRILSTVRLAGDPKDPGPGP
ncbi:hypothetical protein BCL76_10394 [Streptomyces sp. CG 926]|uniref:hypothetical protein n=1 Tax=Streptomyces sp. CG 926 TaxID=1882405 RepID=UPI000D6D1482|nr:hypothetical protein [Streptomyces sp. CG 926]PWK71868.1 hypothetical protein BCL76_10394 [Streptomyces sp. CG 926]